jgi:diacylglycerol kinase (ATP)
MPGAERAQLMRILLIFNPGAGPQDEPSEATLLQLIRDAGHDVSLCAHDDHDGIAGCSDGHDLVAIAGGDGTAGRLARRLHGAAVPVTFIPTGTANNIARSLALAHRTPAELIAGWAEAEVRRLDLGVIEGPMGARTFIEGVGAGLFTRTMLEIDAFKYLADLSTPEEKIAEALAILTDRLRTFRTRPMNMRLDGEDISGEYLMVEAMNIQFVGPNLYVAPVSDPDDGLLDIVLVGEQQRRDLLAYLASWRRGDLLAPRLPTRRGKHLQIEWLGSTLHIDDEPWPPEGEGEYAVPSTIDIRVHEHALQVLVPR